MALVMHTRQHINCPICNKSNTWQPENRFKPFCSDRCKLIDLGEWASETRKIAGSPVTPIHAEDSEEHFF